MMKPRTHHIYCHLLLLFISLSYGCIDSGQKHKDLPWRVTEKTFTHLHRAIDMAVLPGNEELVVAVSLDSNLVYRLNALNGAILETKHKRMGRTQCLIQSSQGILLVQDASPNPQLIKLSPEESDPEIFLTLPDFRLYRVASASISHNNRYLWLTSNLTMSSLYGHINSALFRIDLQAEKCDLMRGTPLPLPVPWSVDDYRPQSAPRRYSDRNWLVCSSASGEAIVADIHANRFLIYSDNSPENVRSVKTSFSPTVLPRSCGQFLPYATKDIIGIFNLEKGTTRTVDIKGDPLAMCVSSDGCRAFLSATGSNKITQIDLLSGQMLSSIDFARDNGVRLIRDARRGHDTFEIVGLMWTDSPSRLIGLGYDGYILIIAKLTQERAEERRPKQHVNLTFQTAPPPSVAHSSDSFVIEYFDNTDSLCYAVSKIFGHNGKSGLQFVDSNGDDYWVDTTDVRSLQFLDRTTDREIAMWPPYFPEKADIPQIHIRIVRSNERTETLRAWGTLWFCFTDGIAGERIAVHPGQVRTVWYPQREMPNKPDASDGK